MHTFHVLQNIPNLTFVLNMSSGGYRNWYDGYGFWRPVPLTAWAWYERVALALRRLGPLKDCFIHLSYSAPDVSERRRRERTLEKAIMGPQYDSTKKGKPRETMTALAGKFCSERHNALYPYGR